MPRQRGVLLRNPFTYRLTDEQVERLQQRTDEMGAKNPTECARELLLIALQSPADFRRLLLRESVLQRELLFCTAQSFFQGQERKQYEELYQELLANADRQVDRLLDDAVKTERVLWLQRQQEKGDR